ncbi:hypothetical protein D3C80_1860780 [compost metagenome]
MLAHGRFEQRLQLVRDLLAVTRERIGYSGLRHLGQRPELLKHWLAPAHGYRQHMPWRQLVNILVDGVRRVDVVVPHEQTQRVAVNLGFKNRMFFQRLQLRAK